VYEDNWNCEAYAVFNAASLGKCNGTWLGGNKLTVLRIIADELL
jgi:hypothetical protein